MNEATPKSVMAEFNNLSGSQRRRSPRLASPPQDTVKTEAKMALGSGAAKRFITVRKIVPRKTVLPSEHDKENQPRRSGSGEAQQKKQKISTPTAVPERRRASPSSSPGEKKKKAAVMPSPILPSSPPPSTNPPVDPEDAVWSQKVRRSYSRLSDRSRDRDTLFGFEKLQTPQVMRGSRPAALELSGPLSGLNSFTSLLEAEDCGSGLPDPDIPGVAVVKEKRRRKKVQQIASADLDALAARMNAEFEEAEGFELVVE
ncbi:sororin [Salarias fasciatus]|uniref:sororin n=1 Tax=Salarias fasciatus TaxID=181472 RepID=UPI0011767969|nr:sororin [Salarias fasciatus]